MRAMGDFWERKEEQLKSRQIRERSESGGGAPPTHIQPTAPHGVFFLVLASNHNVIGVA